ncbi:MAG: lipopolysaccharide heptosyltransferase II [Candidatus Omnitrophica bacterium]|nr:lipopolysaccharide heptosyltransferase II [Candidatus Omnitrophota bacterium]
MLLPVDRPPRILITRTDRIGDLVLSTPVFQVLREKYPGAWLSCLTFLENQEIVKGNPFLDEIILYDKKGSEKGFWGNLRFAHGIARRKFDVVIHLHATNRMHWVGWLAKIPVRIGWDRKCPWAINHAYQDVKKKGLQHEVEYNFDLLQFLGVEKPESLKTFFPVQERSRRSLENLLRNHQVSLDRGLVILSPGASCPSKRWPARRFGELINGIRQKQEVTFIAIGTSEDQSLVRQIQQVADQPVLDLSGRLNLGMLGALFEKTALLISNDSGPVHIASALAVPVVSIFGRNDPGLSPTRWRPLGENSKVIWKDVGCEKCLAHRCEINFLCMDAVSVAEVLKAAESLLEPSFEKVKGTR